VIVTKLLALSVLAFLAGTLTPAAAAELVMFEERGCAWCSRWHEEIGPAYPKTDEGRLAPLRRVNLKERPHDLDFLSGIYATPTFVVIDQGHEIGRIVGYPGADFFWPMLAQIFEKAGRERQKSAAHTFDASRRQTSLPHCHERC
jgi:thioredoxin-related protein